MDYRHLFDSILFAAAVCACAKQDPFNRELGLQSRLVEVPSETGLTPVMVFSNTSWKAGFVSPVNWASLDRLSGTGSSQVKFAFAGNYGRARKLSIAFEAGSSRDTLVIIQASGISSPVLTLTPSFLNVASDVTAGKVLLTMNIQENLDEIRVSVSYPEAGEEWVSGISFTDTSLAFSMTPNTGAVARRAIITLSHKDAYDKEIMAQLFLTQNPA